MARSVDQLLGLLPPNWGSFSPEQKIAFYNANNVTPTELLSVGVAPTDLSFMFSRGYSGGGGMMSADTVSTQDPNAVPATKAEAKDIPARYTNIEVVKAPTADADQSQEPDKYFATDSETGDRVELLKASEYPVGNGPEGTEWLARRAGDMITTSDGRFLPFEAVDSKGNIIGTWNMQKNELSTFANVVGGATKVAAVLGTGYALGSAAGLFDGSYIGADSFFGAPTTGAPAAGTTAGGGGGGLTIGSGGQTGLTIPAGDAGFLSGTSPSALGGGSLGTGLSTTVAGNGLSTLAGLEGVLGAGESLVGAGTGLTVGNVTGLAPGLTGMGGGQGLLTTAAGGGTLGATGVTGAASVPVIGSPGSFINNPAVVGTPITGITDTGTTLPGTVTGTPGVGAPTTTPGVSTPTTTPTASNAGLLSQLLGGQSLTDFLSKLAGTGIDYARLQALADEASRTGKSLSELATQAGEKANVQFTPYTVTTGAGITAFGTDAAGRPTATATASPEYQALRNQALAQAGTTLGSINPADSAQALYDRARALAAPTEQRQQEQLLSNLGARGLLGIGRNLPTVGGTTAAVNPYVESLLSAQRTADANLALQSQQFGTQEAMRQQQLAQALQGQGMAVDTAAQGLFAPSLQFGSTQAANAQQNAANQLRADLAGLGIRVPFEAQGYQARQEGITGVSNLGRGLFGLPTTPGNTASTNIVGNLLNYGFKELFGG
jgi:hypothetical protein